MNEASYHADRMSLTPGTWIALLMLIVTIMGIGAGGVTVIYSASSSNGERLARMETELKGVGASLASLGNQHELVIRNLARLDELERWRDRVEDRLLRPESKGAP